MSVVARRLISGGGGVGSLEERTHSELGIRVERVTGIEPAFSAWEIDSGSFVTCTVSEKTSSAVLSSSTSVAL